MHLERCCHGALSEGHTALATTLAGSGTLVRSLAIEQCLPPVARCNGVEVRRHIILAAVPRLFGWQWLLRKLGRPCIVLAIFRQQPSSRGLPTTLTISVHVSAGRATIPESPSHARRPPRQTGPCAKTGAALGMGATFWAKSLVHCHRLSWLHAEWESMAVDAGAQVPCAGRGESRGSSPIAVVCVWRGISCANGFLLLQYLPS